MKTRYFIKNFRVFDQNGATIDIEPMTFLVGCNSSGKSSIVKSLFLLKSIISSKFDEKHPVVGTTIDFSSYPLNTLGSFQNVVRASSRTKVIGLEYDIHSKYINEDVTVSLELKSGELGNAVVSAITVRKADGSIIITANDNSIKGNLLSLKENFKQYLVATQLRRERNRLLNPRPSVYLKDNEEKAKSLYNKALEFCPAEYLNEVEKDWSIRPISLDNEAMNSFTKFKETGIITYYSIFDDIKGLNNVEELRAYLKSLVKKDGVIKDKLFSAIDCICNDYDKSRVEGFLPYYRSYEERMLAAQAELVRNSNCINGANLFFAGGEIIDYLEGSLNFETLKREWNVNYGFIHEVLDYITDDNTYSHITRASEHSEYYRTHSLYFSIWKDFLQMFFLEIVSTDITEGLAYISSSRIVVRRMYPLEDNNEFTNGVKHYYEAKTKFLSLNPPLRVKTRNTHGSGFVIVTDFMPGDFINKWMRVFNIGDHLCLEMDKNGLGLLVIVYNSPSDKKGRLLADMGYGITQLFSILLQIEEMILYGFFNKYQGKVFCPAGKDLEGILDSFEQQPIDPRTVSIEEPEIHLHPDFQALLAEMFYEAYKKYNIHFIVETHSEYLIRRIQLLYASLLTEDSENPFAINYFPKDASPYKMEFKENGHFDNRFGDGFYDAAAKDALKLSRLAREKDGK